MGLGMVECFSTHSYGRNLRIFSVPFLFSFANFSSGTPVLTQTYLTIHQPSIIHGFFLSL